MQLKEFGCPKTKPTIQGKNDLAFYKAQLGDITYGQLQGAKLTFPSSMRPSTRCCLVSAQLHLGRAKAGELLIDSANVELLRPERMSQFDDRDQVLSWLAGSVVPVAKVPADGLSMLHSGNVACTSAISMASSGTTASEKSSSRRSSVSIARSKEASAAASKALAGL